MICVLIVGLMRLRVVFNSVVHGYYVFVVGGCLCCYFLVGFGGFVTWVWWFVACFDCCVIDLGWWLCDCVFCCCLLACMFVWFMVFGICRWGCRLDVLWC